MKILQLTKKFPYPLKDGESIAITNLAKAFDDLGCELTLLSMNTKKHYYNVDDLPEDFNHYKKIYTIGIDNELKAKDAFFNLFSKKSYHIARFVSEDFKNQLIRILQEESFDVIQLETLYLAPYVKTIRQYSNAIVAMRAHNVEHEIWARISKHTSNPIKKWYLNLLTVKLERFEVEHLKTYDLLVPITERDLLSFQAFGYKNPAKVTPIGVDQSQYQPDFSIYKKELSISFIGSLDWMPNLEGLKWFLDEVWPKAVQEFPNLKFHIAGRNTPDWMHQLDLKNLHIHGEVPDAAIFVNQHPLTIVPLLSGSGMRAKILEGMALGKVVLTTAVGLEGIDAEDKKEVLIANTAEEFLNLIRFCHQQKANLRAIGKAAHQFVTSKYDNLEVARRLLNTYENLIDK